MFDILTTVNLNTKEPFEVNEPIELPISAIELIYLLDIVENISIEQIIMTGLKHYANEIINNKLHLYEDYIKKRFSQSIQSLT